MAGKKELIDYARNCLKRGMSEEQIRRNLISKGWANYEINAAVFSALEANKKENIASHEQLISYIRKSLERKISLDEIRKKLGSSGWNNNEINEAIGLAGPVEEPEQNWPGEKLSGFTIKLLLIPAVILVLVLAIGVPIYVLNERGVDSKEVMKSGGITIPECAKNSDCSEDKICNAGKCIVPMIKQSAPEETPSMTPSEEPTAVPSVQPTAMPSESPEEELIVIQEEVQIENEINDCGTSFQCFIDASSDCEKTKVRFEYETSENGIERTTTDYYELRGFEGDKCLFYLKKESIDINYGEDLIQSMLDSGITQDGIKQRERVENIQANSKEGSNGICKIKTGDLNSALTTWKEDNLKTGIFPSRVAECSGNYFS